MKQIAWSALFAFSSLATPSPSYTTLADAVDHACIALAASVPTQVSHCRMTGNGAFGNIGSESFHYALYCLDDAPAESGRCEMGGIALFTRDAPGKRITRWHLSSDDSGNIFTAPRIISTAHGLLLDMPVGIPGTGNFNASKLFLRQGSRWVPIDNTSWEKDLARRLPAGLAVWKGIWPDLRKMEAISSLYREKDGNCCPTGGSVKIKLSLKGQRLSLDSVQVRAAKP